MSASSEGGAATADGAQWSQCQAIGGRCLAYDMGQVVGEHVLSALLTFVFGAEEGSRLILQKNRTGITAQVTGAVQRADTREASFDLAAAQALRARLDRLLTTPQAQHRLQLKIHTLAPRSNIRREYSGFKATVAPFFVAAGRNAGKGVRNGGHCESVKIAGDFSPRADKIIRVVFGTKTWLVVSLRRKWPGCLSTDVVGDSWNVGFVRRYLCDGCAGEFRGVNLLGIRIGFAPVRKPHLM